MDCAMEQSLKKTAVQIYGVQYTARPLVRVTPQTVGQSGTSLSEWNARHIAFAHTCGTAIENRP